MLRVLGAQLRVQPGRVATLGIGIVVAAVAFVLLTAATRTSELHVRGTLKSAFRPAYDILVRPPGSETPLERRERLVRPNFLSGLFGGISFRQWRQLKRIRGVAVAAPIANIGYILPFGKVTIPITDLVDAAPYQLYRIRQTWIANGGLSQYPAPSVYVYYTPRDRFVSLSDNTPWEESGPGARPPQPSCSGFNQSGPGQPTSPFPPLASQSSLACFPTTTRRLVRTGYVASVNTFLPPSVKFVGTQADVYFPIYISAIDPVQEAKLVRLDRAVVSGRYLRPNEGFSSFRLPGIAYKLAPILASSRTYVDERLELTIQRLHIPPRTNVPRALASGACLRNVVPCRDPLGPPTGALYPNARQFVERLSGTTIAKRGVAAATVYRDLLTTSWAKPWPAGTFAPGAYWTTSPARYRPLGPGRLAPVPVRNPAAVWRSQFSGYITPPRDNVDMQFRRLHARVVSNEITGGAARWNPLKVVGEFDPEKLPSYSPLSKVPLETYYPPELLPGDELAERALQGKRLLPNQNLGDYIQQPPLFLTTLQGLSAFLNPDNWSRNEGAGTAIPKAQRLAPISAIRVKVAGVSGPDPLSLQRIRVVAQRIHEETGLQVDITAGSSPHAVLISLPKGRFGRPPLLLSEGWSKKGVTVSFLNALDRKDLALFALILIICGFFVANGAFASVTTRRVEIGTLLTLGWSKLEVFAAVLCELALVGLLAGVAGSALAAVLVAVLSLDFALVNVLYVLPLAVGLALAAGLVPAWRAARGSPLDAIRPPVSGGARALPVRSVLRMALVNLWRLRARALVGGAGLVIGAAALTVLLAIQAAFQGTLVGTLLGSALSVQVRGADFLAIGLTVALAALSVADVLYLNLRERSAELVTLRTVGWSERELLALVEAEALLLALAATLAGAAVGIVLGALLLAIPVLPLLAGAAIATAGGVLAATLASLLPLSQLRRLTPPTVLAAE